MDVTIDRMLHTWDLSVCVCVNASERELTGATPSGHLRLAQSNRACRFSAEPVCQPGATPLIKITGSHPPKNVTGIQVDVS